MPKVRFLAVSPDPRPEKAGTTYGPGHETDFDETDYEYVIALRMSGAAEIIDPTGLPTTPPAADAPSKLWAGF
jgi:hypothetical protein